jgi:hypothetical protein
MTRASVLRGAGGLVDVDVPWPGAATAPTNQYGVTVSATPPAGTVSRRQVLTPMPIISQCARYVVAVRPEPTIRE